MKMIVIIMMYMCPLSPLHGLWRGFPSRKHISAWCWLCQSAMQINQFDRKPSTLNFCAPGSTFIKKQWSGGLRSENWKSVWGFRLDGTCRSHFDFRFKHTTRQHCVSGSDQPSHLNKLLALTVKPLNILVWHVTLTFLQHMFYHVMERLAAELSNQTQLAEFILAQVQNKCFPSDLFSISLLWKRCSSVLFRSPRSQMETVWLPMKQLQKRAGVLKRKLHLMQQKHLPGDVLMWQSANKHIMIYRCDCGLQKH